MDIDTAATFFVGTILIGLGVIIVSLVILLLNNLFNKYWKPVKFTLYNIPHYTYADPPMDTANTTNTEAESNNTIKIKNAGR